MGFAKKFAGFSGSARTRRVMDFGKSAMRKVERGLAVSLGCHYYQEKRTGKECKEILEKSGRELKAEVDSIPGFEVELKKSVKDRAKKMESKAKKLVSEAPKKNGSEN